MDAVYTQYIDWAYRLQYKNWGSSLQYIDWRCMRICKSTDVHSLHWRGSAGKMSKEANMHHHSKNMHSTITIHFDIIQNICVPPSLFTLISSKIYAFHHHHSLRYHPKHMHSTIIHFLICYRNSKYPVMRLAQWNRQKHWNSTKRIKQIEEEKMNKQSGSNRAASARPEQCILPEFSPLVLGGAPQPPTPATSLLELCSGRHHHLLLLLGSQSLLHLLLAGGSQLHTQLPALLQCVCVKNRGTL